jgi:transcriptional regulator with XRE-family HTH domain
MARSTHHQDYQTLIALLRELRTGQGVHQAVLGNRLGNTQTFISKVERGERRLDLVEFIELCEALDFDPANAFRQYLRRRAAARSLSGKLRSGQPKTRSRTKP